MSRKKKVTAILTADLHIDFNAPKCRDEEEFFESMFYKLELIFGLGKHYKAPILVAGDLGNKAKWPNVLLADIIELHNRYKPKIIVTPGQHDLPEHRIGRWREGALGVLYEAGVIEVYTDPTKVIDDEWNQDPVSFTASPYGTDPCELRVGKTRKYLTVLIAHRMVRESKKKDFKDQWGNTAAQMMKEYDTYDLILTGDNHIPFYINHKSRLLVNPGSMMRRNVKQIKHRPRVYLWHGKRREITEEYLPIKKDVISEQHLTEKEDREMRMVDYTVNLKETRAAEVSFEDNMDVYLASRTVKKGVRNYISKAMEKTDG
jgi:DNA repair exonuclease SbcCD nuclease subunit